MRGSRTFRYSAAVAMTGLLLAACGGDDGDKTSDASTTSAPSSSSAAPSSSAGSASSAPASSAGGSTGSTTGGSTAGSGATSAPNAAEDCKETKPGSVLNFAAYAPTATLDPLQSSSGLVGGTDLSAIYDVLVRWDKDTHDYVPVMAESVTPNADFTEWTIKLRPGIKYSDGATMKAQDIVDNMKRLTGQGRNSARGLINTRIDLDNSKATDELTAVFKMKSPWSSFPGLLGESGGNIVNPAVGSVMDATGKATVISTDPKGAGAGPYTVERWAPGESPYLVLKARPDYWGGAPCIETINFLLIPLDTAKAEAMETGELDVAFMRTQSVIDDTRQKGYGELMELQSAGLTVIINQGDGNHAAITNDLKFRQALYAAIDPEIVKQRAYDNALFVQDSLVGKESVFFTEGQPAPKRDPQVAKQLVSELKQGGWDGKIRLMCANTVPDAIVVIESLLEAAGMDVDPFPTDTNTTIAKIAVEKDWDLACWGLPIADSAAWRALPNNFSSSSSSNRIGWKNPDMDAAIDEFMGAKDLGAQKTAIGKMAKIYAEDVPVAVIGGMEEGIFTQKKVKDVLQTEMSIFLFADAKIDG